MQSGGMGVYRPLCLLVEARKKETTRKRVVLFASLLGYSVPLRKSFSRFRLLELGLQPLRLSLYFSASSL